MPCKADTSRNGGNPGKEKWSLEMAKPKAQDVENVADNSDDIDTSLLTESPSDWQWETVVAESPTTVIFEVAGDTFIGKFIERRTITPDNGRTEPFDLFIFEGRDGQPYAVNTSYKLDMALTADVIGRFVRLVYIKDVETGRGLQPMKDFRVDIKL
jgi:hypothetical protein